MLPNVIFAFLHFVTAIGVIIGLIYERITFQQNLSLTDARRIQKADMIYGVSALLVLIFGFLRAYLYEKGSEYYFSNLFFYLKLAAFTAVGLLSIYPTIKFLQWNKSLKANQLPVISVKEYKTIKTLINLEIIGIVIMLLSASLMAKGFGMQ